MDTIGGIFGFGQEERTTSQTDAMAKLEEEIFQLRLEAGDVVETDSPCAAEGGAAAVRAFALAVESPGALGPFVRENADLFADDGDAIRCLRILINGLEDGTLEQPSTEDSAWITPMDMPEAPLEYRNWQNSHFGGQLAGTLEQLTVTLPEMADGDLGPFQNTRLYASTQELWVAVGTDPGRREIQQSWARSVEQEIMALVAKAASQRE